MQGWTRGLCQTGVCPHPDSQVRILYLALVRISHIPRPRQVGCSVSASVESRAVKICIKYPSVYTGVTEGYFFFDIYFLPKSGWNIDGKKSESCACPSAILLGVLSAVFTARSYGFALCRAYSNELKSSFSCVTFFS